MKNFRDYESLIRKYVNDIDNRDPNWTFTVKSFGKHRIRIRWSYLDYCGEKDNCFILRLRDPDDEFEDSFLTVRTPDDQLIEGYFVSDNRRGSWQSSWESGLLAAIEELASYAHSRY